MHINKFMRGLPKSSYRFYCKMTRKQLDYERVNYHKALDMIHKTGDPLAQREFLLMSRGVRSLQQFIKDQHIPYKGKEHEQRTTSKRSRSKDPKFRGIV